MQTYKAFFTNVLHKLNLPVTQATLEAFYAVSTLEGLNDRYNPLNSVVPSGKSTQFNSVGVQDYKTYGNGVNGTVKLLRGSPWVDVVEAIREKRTTQAILNEFKAVYATWNAHVNFPRNPGLGEQPLGGGEPVKPKPHHKPPAKHRSKSRYTVKPGDTLYGIAGHVFGPGQNGRWHELAHANGIVKPWIIYPGQKLTIPR